MAAEAAKTVAPEGAPAAEKQTNCPACNKLIKKLKRYYRNGIFYCNKKCWAKKTKKKEESDDKAE